MSALGRLQRRDGQVHVTPIGHRTGVKAARCGRRGTKAIYKGSRKDRETPANFDRARSTMDGIDAPSSDSVGQCHPFRLGRALTRYSLRLNVVTVNLKTGISAALEQNEPFGGRVL